MKFKELLVGQVFEFDHSKLTCSCTGLAYGPWVKTSTRCYRKDTNPFSLDYIERQEHASGLKYQVGTINAEVLLQGATK